MHIFTDLDANGFRVIKEQELNSQLRHHDVPATGAGNCTECSLQPSRKATTLLVNLDSAGKPIKRLVSVRNTPVP